MIEELERVALTIDIPEHQLEAGDMGTVVDITTDGSEYTIEFFALNGDTLAVVPLAAGSIRRVGSREIAHARVLA